MKDVDEKKKNADSEQQKKAVSAFLSMRAKAADKGYLSKKEIETEIGEARKGKLG